MTDQLQIPVDSVESSILFVRGQKVILDRTLARLYGVSTEVLNQSVKRNPERFPSDFMFQLTMDEAKALPVNRTRSQNEILKKASRGESLTHRRVKGLNK